MWIPGFFLGPAAILAGVLMLVLPHSATGLFQSAARVSRDPNPERFSPGILVAPAIGAIMIGVAVLLITIFLRPS